MKKIIRILLSMALVLSILPFSAVYAEGTIDATYDSNSKKIKVEGKEYDADKTITDFANADSKFTIKETGENGDFGTGFYTLYYDNETVLVDGSTITLAKDDLNTIVIYLEGDPTIDATYDSTSKKIKVEDKEYDANKTIEKFVEDNSSDGFKSDEFEDDNIAYVVLYYNEFIVNVIFEEDGWSIDAEKGSNKTIASILDEALAKHNDQKYDGDIDDSKFTYNGQEYRVGFGNTSNDGQTLHIDDGATINWEPDKDTLSLTLMIGVGKYSNGDITGSADNEMINRIFNTLVVKDYNGQKISNYTDYSFKDKTTQNDINTRNYQFTFPNVVGDYKVTIDFTDLNGKSHSVNYNVKVNKNTHFTREVDDDISKLNSILASKNSLKEYIGEDNLTNDAIITFNFDPAKTYSGTIIVNCYESDEDTYQIYFNGGSGNYDWEADYISNYTYGDRATLNGSIVNNGGLWGVSNINFVNTETESTRTINGLTCTSSVEGISPDIWQVEGCSFTGYNYAVYSNGRGLISGIKFCTFKNNNVGVYININQHACSYSDSLFNTFVNNKVAIDIEKVTGKNPYDYVISKNYFFNDLASYKDYVVNETGTFFFINSYYGTSYISNSESITNANYRNPVVETGDNSEVVTGPLIRYPESKESVLGFDTGSTGINKLNNGASNIVHVEELENATNDVSIDIFDTDSKSDLGTLVFEKEGE